jgi:hypothetical protein
MTIIIREHQPGKDLEDFIRAGFEVFRGDPHWVPPLDMDIRERLTPSKNPFFSRAEVTLFTAWKDGNLVGRCSASIDREHLRIWKDDTGFFGFFDTINDEEVGKALIDTAAAWLQRRNMKRMVGPFSLYANEEVGILIEGFDYPPMLMMGHSRDYQHKIAEASGLEKEKDLFAWRYAEKEFPPRVKRAYEAIKAMPEVNLRAVNPKNMEQELTTIMDIYNDAWAGKWGVVPALPDEVKKVASDLKLIIDPDIAFMAEIDGRPVGMCIMLPNINEVIADLNGKLFPLGLLKILWRLKVNSPKTSRLMMLGIRKELRNIRRYGGLSHAMYMETAIRGYAKGYEWAELSWTREDDAPINVGIRSMGAKIYKKYRTYHKSL